MSYLPVVACFCSNCKIPYYSQLRSLEEVREEGINQCEMCGEVIQYLVFGCDCTSAPVHAVPPDGTCEWCGSELTRPYIKTRGDEDVPMLKQLIAKGENRGKN